MKKIICIIILLCAMYCAKAEYYIYDYFNWGMPITSVTIYSNGGPTSLSAVLHNPSGIPSNATFVWSIMKPSPTSAFCYGNGIYCSVSFNDVGYYRLICDVYVNGVRIDGITSYINVI